MTEGSRFQSPVRDHESALLSHTIQRNGRSVHLGFIGGPFMISMQTKQSPQPYTDNAHLYIDLYTHFVY